MSFISKTRAALLGASALCLAAVAGAGSAAAAPIHASTVTFALQGQTNAGGAIAADRSDPSNALGNTDAFFSLGFFDDGTTSDLFGGPDAGGFLLVDFGQDFGPGQIMTIERTNLPYPEERAEIFVLPTAVGGAFIGMSLTLDQVLGVAGSLISVGFASNLAPSTSLSLAGACAMGCSHALILDRTNPALHNRSADAFDVQAISVDVPEPATLALLGAGLAAAGVMRRRRR